MRLGCEPDGGEQVSSPPLILRKKPCLGAGQIPVMRHERHHPASLTHRLARKMTEHENAIVELGRTTAEVRRRDIELGRNFRSFPRLLWYLNLNRDVALAQRGIADSYTQIGVAVEENKRTINPESKIHQLADAIIIYTIWGHASATRRAEITEFMDANAVKRPFYAFWNGLKWYFTEWNYETNMRKSAARIKFLWPTY